MFEIEEKIRKIVEKIYKKLDFSPELFKAKIDHIVDFCVNEIEDKKVPIDNVDIKFIEQIIYKHLI